MLKYKTLVAFFVGVKLEETRECRVISWTAGIADRDKPSTTTTTGTKERKARPTTLFPSLGQSGGWTIRRGKVLVEQASSGTC